MARCKHNGQHARSGVTLSIGALLLFAFGGPSTALSEEIVLAPGDKVQVFIPGAETPEQNYQIDIQGEIDLGIYGKIKIAGISVGEANERIRNHLGKYLRSISGISILLRQRNRIVLITGCVKKPGVINIEPTDDIWQAVHRAGGLDRCADISKVALFRNGEEVDVDVRSYLTRDSKKKLPELMTGDTILVPSGPGLSASDIAEPFLGHEAIRRRVFVIGAVSVPGMYNRSPKMNILTLVAAANGPLANADLSHTILLTKDESLRIDLQKEFSVDEKSRKQLPDDSGAIIYIPFLQENIDKRLGEHINVVGPFGRQGRIPVSGPIKLIDAIGLVGGTAADARLRRLRVIEEGPGYTLAKTYNLKRYLKRGGALGREMVKPGSTLVLGRRNLEPLTVTMSILGAVGMISTSVTLWLTSAGALGGG